MADRKFLFVRIAALSFMTVTASALLFAAEGDYQLPVTVNEKQQTDKESLLNLNDPYMKDKDALHKSREKILKIAAYIVPGHGKPFKIKTF